jgi:hypothetical protein
VPNTHYRSTRVLRYPKISGGVVVALLVSTLGLAQFGDSPIRAGAVGAQHPVASTGGQPASRARHTRAATVPATSTVPVPVVMKTAAVVINAVPATTYVVSLIKKAFPPTAWHAAEVVAWCESKFHPLDIHYDSNGTHDRGLFQLNDGGTEQYLLQSGVQRASSRPALLARRLESVVVRVGAVIEVG